MRAWIGRPSAVFLFCLLSLAAPSAADDPAPAAEPVAAAAAPFLDDEFVDDYEAELGLSVPDPIEPLNRKLFFFNEKLDDYVISPITDAYQLVVPKPARLCARRFFRNLRSPVYFVNAVLQLRFEDAAETAARFALNSTAGWVGLFDPGSEVGWEAHPSDFGQTLGMYGVRSGPYLVLPVMGPSTLRDGFGDLVDRAFDPMTYLLGMGDLIFIGGSSGFITREANDERLAALRESSVDYYAAMRSAFTQNRESKIAELRARVGWGVAEQRAAAGRAAE
jgi:phospholipid-binding lipoprotein MlaA